MLNFCKINTIFMQLNSFSHYMNITVFQTFIIFQPIKLLFQKFEMFYLFKM